jgi:hypothetical protein
MATWEPTMVNLGHAHRKMRHFEKVVLGVVQEMRGELGWRERSEVHRLLKRCSSLTIVCSCYAGNGVLRSCAHNLSKSLRLF